MNRPFKGTYARDLWSCEGLNVHQNSAGLPELQFPGRPLQTHPGVSHKGPCVRSACLPVPQAHLRSRVPGSGQERSRTGLTELRDAGLLVAGALPGRAQVWRAEAAEGPVLGQAVHLPHLDAPHARPGALQGGEG